MFLLFLERGQVCSRENMGTSTKLKCYCYPSKGHCQLYAGQQGSSLANCLKSLPLFSVVDKTLSVPMKAGSWWTCFLREESNYGHFNYHIYKGALVTLVMGTMNWTASSEQDSLCCGPSLGRPISWFPHQLSTPNCRMLLHPCVGIQKSLPYRNGSDNLFQHVTGALGSRVENRCFLLTLPHELNRHLLMPTTREGALQSESSEINITQPLPPRSS